ncbi:TrkA family potassium uptake protein [Geobacillus sp. NFOSA3]|uniref:Potassium uptake system protein n=1 Tax=Parageobacillus galactosidasius TaxID=883812 RepID=A0A226QMS2_9BACL|nr:MULTISPECIES: TrkA family potassium uptake protein [Bacillaceae]NNU93525.1 TrkA family potassium uptake protein [Geobacillus sp. NFOSA3]PDM39791.1 TrkA family potassium uptake protein [Parageobacillus yumthangensis]TXK91014.1 TrkA family potassium uptake protein [Parageobacillus sp. SY1]MED4970572.1 TrkA family potassium uptake protein [Parageobacillus toebii]MED4989469.1 TrkA family potassium uptake protein [Parageobacillus toebii]
MKGQYAVIGLGRFGSSLATTLHQAGNEVLAIDRNEERIEEYKDHVTYAVVADSTDEEALKSVGIRNFDAVIVAIGDDIQASILTVLILKELEVKKVVAKAINKRHGQVLYKVGADWVVFPERDMGERVATQLMSPNVLDYIELAKDYSIKEVKVPPSMIEKNLRELNLRARFNITVIAIISDGKVSISPSPDRIIKEGDILVVIGENKDLDRFEKFN